MDPLPVCEGLHPVGLILEDDHRVFAQAEDVVDVDPHVIRARDGPERALHAS